MIDLMNLTPEQVSTLMEAGQQAGGEDSSDRLTELVTRLMFDGRDSELGDAFSDMEYRFRLYEEYDMLTEEELAERKAAKQEKDADDTGETGKQSR